MPNLTSVGISAGVPNSGTGTVSTLDNLLGAAGTPSANVQTVQGVTGMTPVKVDGSAVTQPVSGTFWQATQPVSGTLAATQSGTWTVQPGNTANTTAWKVQLYDGTTNLPILAGSSGAPASTAPALAVSVRDANANGQAAMAASAPVVIASDQSAVSVKPTITNLVSGTISTAMTSTTSTSLIAAPGAGLNNYITQITVSNSHATVGTDILIQDGSAGTTLYVIPAAAAYGGATITFPVPLKQPTANTALFCANVTTGSSTKVSASGFKA